MSILLYRLRSL